MLLKCLDTAMVGKAIDYGVCTTVFSYGSYVKGSFLRAILADKLHAYKHQYLPAKI